MPVTRDCPPKDLARLLCRAPVRFSHPLGYLDAAYADQSHWFAYCDEQGAVRATVLVYRGLSRPALFICGDPKHAALILGEVADELPKRVTGHVPEGHMEYLADYYRPSEELKGEQRMGLERRSFALDEWPLEEDVEPLTHRDTGAIMQIYQHYPDNYFEPVQLETGLYFGLRAEDGTLASIAGIHNVSDRYDVAAIGNLVTHPDHRGRGLAKRCTARLLHETFKRVSLVTLDVERGNEPALRTYRRFGFSVDSNFDAGELIRR